MIGQRQKSGGAALTAVADDEHRACAACSSRGFVHVSRMPHEEVADAACTRGGGASSSSSSSSSSSLSSSVRARCFFCETCEKCKGRGVLPRQCTDTAALRQAAALATLNSRQARGRGGATVDPTMPTATTPSSTTGDALPSTRAEALDTPPRGLGAHASPWVSEAYLPATGPPQLQSSSASSGQTRAVRVVCATCSSTLRLPRIEHTASQVLCMVCGAIQRVPLVSWSSSDAPPLATNAADAYATALPNSAFGGGGGGGGGGSSLPHTTSASFASSTAAAAAASVQAPSPPRTTSSSSSSSSSAQPLQQRPRWVDDKEVSACAWCGNKFGALFSRHHCRLCGNVFCNDCCRQKIDCSHLGYSKPERACRHCIAKVNQRVNEQLEAQRRRQ